MSSWPGPCVPRDISGDRRSITYNILRRGLLKDAAHAWEVSALLLAGTPQQDLLDIEWDEDRGAITLAAYNHAGVRVERDFFQERGGWAVEHACFDLPAQHRRAGHAKRMMRASVEAYDRLGVTRIKLVAGGPDGGYVWARAGFVADDEKSARAVLLRRASGLEPAKFQIMRDVIMQSTLGNLLFDVARATVAGEQLGRDFLRGSSWPGHIDLTDQTYRLRLAAYLR